MWVSPIAAADRVDALNARGHTVVKLRLAEIIEPEEDPESYDDDGEDPDFEADEGELDFEADDT